MRIATVIGIALIGMVAFATEVHAQASDLDCDGCVDSSDLAKKAVTTSRIRNKSVTTPKIQDGAVTVDKVEPALSNSINTACDPGFVVVGKNRNGRFACEPDGGGGFDTVVYRSAFSIESSGSTSIAAQSCPNGTSIVSAGCNCDIQSGARNIGFVAGCSYDSNTNIGAGLCISEPFFENFSLPPPRTVIDVACLRNSAASSSAANDQRSGYAGTEISGTDYELSTLVQQMQDIALMHETALRARQQ